MKHLAHPTRGQFVHMPKTGGTWVRRKLLRETGRAEHHRAVDLPRPSWGIVRGPSDWYESYWLHCMRANRRRDLKAWGGGSHEFRDVLYGWTHPAPELVPMHEPAVLFDS